MIPKVLRMSYSWSRLLSLVTDRTLLQTRQLCSTTRHQSVLCLLSLVTDRTLLQTRQLCSTTRHQSVLCHRLQAKHRELSQAQKHHCLRLLGFSRSFSSQAEANHRDLFEAQQHHCLRLLGFRRSFSSQAEDPDLSEERLKSSVPFTGPRLNRNRLAWQASFRDVIASKDSSDWLSSDWERVANDPSLPTGPSWEVLCMHTLYQDNAITLGRSLMEYLEQKGEVVSNTLLTFFTGLLGKTSTSAEQDVETKKCFDQLMAASDVLDPASVEVLVTGLSNTKHYRECIKLVEVCQETSNIGPSILLNMLIASIRFQDMVLCTSVLSMMEENIEPGQMATYAAKIIEACLSAKNEEGLVASMEFFRKHGQLIPMHLTEEIAESFQRHQPNKWDIQKSYIHYRTGRCVHCQYQMEKNEINSAEFETLRKGFLEQVIVGSNIFYKSTPQEVDHFVDFVQHKGPFDVVIDGLNVLNRQSQRSPKSPDVLYKTIKYFQDENKKVLLLGSKVLTRYTNTLRRLHPKPAIYMTNTSKADDAFFLYAALQSGQNTLIVSKDKLRDHKFLINSKLRHLFQQWLKRAQIYDWFFSRYGDFTVGRCHLYSIGPHRDEGGWHLPVNDIDKDYPFGKFQVMCLRDTTVAGQNERGGGHRLTQPKKTEISDNRKRKNSNGYGKKGWGKPKEGSKQSSLNLDELL